MNQPSEPIEVIVALLSRRGMEAPLDLSLHLATKQAAEALLAYALDPAPETQTAVERILDALDLLTDALDMLNDHKA